MINYVKGSTQIRINSHDVSIIAPVWSVNTYNNLVLVTMTPDYDKKNVLAFNQDGVLLWTIQERPFDFPDTDRPKGYDGTVSHLGKLIALSHINYVIDAMNGRIISELPFSK